jgi:hypothetical protein
MSPSTAITSKEDHTCILTSKFGSYRITKSSSFQGKDWRSKMEIDPDPAFSTRYSSENVREFTFLEKWSCPRYFWAMLDHWWRVTTPENE